MWLRSSPYPKFWNFSWTFIRHMHPRNKAGTLMRVGVVLCCWKHSQLVFPPLQQLNLQLVVQGFKYSNLIISPVSHQQSSISCTLLSRELNYLRSKILCFLDTRELHSQLELRLSLKWRLFTIALLVTLDRCTMALLADCKEDLV